MKSNEISEDLFEKASPLIHCIRNPNLRQELHQQYQRFKEKKHLNTLDAYIEALEMRQESAQIQFNQIANQYRQFNRSIPFQFRPNLTIQQVIDQRFSNVTNRIDCIYKYKKRFLQIEHP
jgi:hypothetical protein